MERCGSETSNPPALHHSITPPNSAEPLLFPLQKLQPHPFRAFEETNSASIRQHSLFEDFQTGGFDFVDFAVEVVGVDGDVLEAHVLFELLFFEELRDVKLDAVQIEAKVFAAVGPGVLLDDLAPVYST